MSAFIVKRYKGQNYKWDGVVWIKADNQTIPPSTVVAQLDSSLTDEDLARFGQSRPGSAEEEDAARLREIQKLYREKPAELAADDDHAAWRRKVAKTSQRHVPHCFCWNCGQFVRPPKPAYHCPNCTYVSFEKRTYCQFCGSILEKDFNCSYCHRPGQPND